MIEITIAYSKNKKCVPFRWVSILYAPRQHTGKNQENKNIWITVSQICNRQKQMILFILLSKCPPDVVYPYPMTIYISKIIVGLGGSVGCAVRLETRRSRVQPPLRSATFFRGDWSWNIFYGHSHPSADSRRAVVSFWWKNVHITG